MEIKNYEKLVQHYGFKKESKESKEIRSDIEKLRVKLLEVYKKVRTPLHNCMKTSSYINIKQKRFFYMELTYFPEKDIMIITTFAEMEEHLYKKSIEYITNNPEPMSIVVDVKEINSISI